MRFSAKVDLSKLRNVLAGQGTDPRAGNVAMRIDMNRAATEAGDLYDTVWDVIEICKEEDAFDEANDLEDGDLTFYHDRVADVRELALQSYPGVITYVSFRIGQALIRLHPHGSEVWIDGPRYKDYAEAEVLRPAFEELVSEGLIRPEKGWSDLFLAAVGSVWEAKAKELKTLEATVKDLKCEVEAILELLAALQH